VHAGSYIDHSVLLADDNGQFSDRAGRQYRSYDMQEPYTIPCATLLQYHYSARYPSCAHTCPTVSWSRCQRSPPPQIGASCRTYYGCSTCYRGASPGQFHKRQTNSHRRVPCDTISRSPISMHLPARALQTLCRLRPVLTVASCRRRHSSVRRY
jgi:hypothetical protein